MKTPECSKVLQLMDEDFSYQDALNIVLNEIRLSTNKNLNKN